MNRLTHGLVLTALLTLAMDAARADIITFDDLSDPMGLGTSVPNGYNGFNWSNLSSVNGTYYPPFSGFANGVISSPMIAFNGNGAPAIISASTDFDFIGGSFVAGWNNGLQLQIYGFDDGVLKFSSTHTLNTSPAQWINANMSSIDQLLFVASGGTPVSAAGSGTHFVMDNFTYQWENNSGPTVAAIGVPEPGSLVLLGLGASGALAYRLVRRRKQQALPIQ